MSGIIRTQDGNGIDINNPLPVKTTGADGIQPVDIQARYTQHIQTHNAVPVTASQVSSIVSVDCDGFSECTVVGKFAGAATLRVEVNFLDGTRMADGASRIIDKAGTSGAYARFNLSGLKSISVYALDTSAVANTVSIEVHLMA